MSRDRRYLCSKISTLIGGSLLCLPDAALWTWGNLSVYVLSYMRMTDVSQSSIQAPWLISFYLIAFVLGIMLAGTASKFLGLIPAIIVGICLFNGGMFLSYFACQYSMLCLNITNGFLPGLGYGLLNCLVMKNVIEWADGNEGLFTAVISTTLTIGGAVNIQVASRYINPDNKTPDLHLGPSKFFTQTDVIRRVPSVYLVLGAFTLSVQFIGLVLIRKHKTNAKDRPIKPNSETTPLQRKHSAVRNNNLGASDNFNEKKGDGKSVDVSMEENSREKDYNASDGDVITSLADSMKSHEGSIKRQVQKEDVESKKIYSPKKEFTPLAVLRNKSFYLLWFVMLCNDVGYVVFSNYYKSFGELFISDDYFLAAVGTGMAVGVASTRIMWGMLIDRMSVKWLMLTFSSSFSFLFCFYYFTPFVSRWLFYVWTVIIACVDSGLYSNYSIATLRLFGHEHFTSNYGLVVSSGIVLNLGAPPLIKIVLSYFGWFGLFFTVAIIDFIAQISVCVAMPWV